MTQEVQHSDIQEILANGTLSNAEKKHRLSTLLDDERQLQRAATESQMVVSADQGERMKLIRRKLDQLGAEEVDRHEKSAATL